jgi:NADH:ubiquinone oxidoreductase subunit 2 (subunit N)
MLVLQNLNVINNHYLYIVYFYINIFYIFGTSDFFLIQYLNTTGLESSYTTDTLLRILLIVFIFSVLFKLGITPFHFWVIDVYEGAPLASTIIFSYLPKLALFHIILKLKFIFGSAFSEFSFFFCFAVWLAYF